MKNAAFRIIRNCYYNWHLKYLCYYRIIKFKINYIIKLHVTYLLPKYAVTWNSSGPTLFLVSNGYLSHGLKFPIKMIIVYHFRAMYDLLNSFHNIWKLLISKLYFDLNYEKKQI